MDNKNGDYSGPKKRGGAVNPKRIVSREWFYLTDLIKSLGKVFTKTNGDTLIRNLSQYKHKTKHMFGRS